MKVLVATSATQGTDPDDLCRTVEGELVLAGTTIEFDRAPRDPLNRLFIGIASSAATTTAIVVERPLMTNEMLGNAIRRLFEHHGWPRLFTPEEIEDGVEDELRAIERAVFGHPEGTVLVRRGTWLWPRRARAA